MVKFSGKTPFTARVPLGAVESIQVGRPQLTLSRSSLLFALSTGEEIASRRREPCPRRRRSQASPGAGTQNRSAAERARTPSSIRVSPVRAQTA
jgi:hypothetical protein